MSEIQLTIIDVTSGRSWTVDVPDDAPVSHLLPALLGKLGLSVVDGSGQALVYQLTHQLEDRETLAEAGVGNGDQLVLIAAAARTSPPRAAGELRVTIRCPATGQSWDVEVPDDAPMSLLLPALVAQLGLPSEDGSGQPLVHQLTHRGTQLRDGETLAEAGVRDGDQLHLFAQGVAGGLPPLFATHPDMTHVHAGTRGTYAEAPPPGDDVDCTAFAPTRAFRGDSTMVQVYAHEPGLDLRVDGLARGFDRRARRRGVTSLGTRICKGSRLTFELRLPDLAPRPVRQELTWRGGWGVVTFEVTVPSDAKRGDRIGTVLVSQDSVPVGDIRFTLSVAGGVRRRRTRPRWLDVDPVGRATRYRKAFISYASKDRTEVLRCVRLLPAVGIDFFQDVLDLDPGDRWETELWRHIDESDVMLLFWSTAAKESEGVEREWRYALVHRGEDFIRPVIIEGPPPVPPPPELRHLHFDDKRNYFLRAAAT